MASKSVERFKQEAQMWEMTDDDRQTEKYVGIGECVSSHWALVRLQHTPQTSADLDAYCTLGNIVVAVLEIIPVRSIADWRESGEEEEEDFA